MCPRKRYLGTSPEETIRTARSPCALSESRITGPLDPGFMRIQECLDQIADQVTQTLRCSLLILRFNPVADVFFFLRTMPMLISSNKLAL